jgi:hypothetical protein
MLVDSILMIVGIAIVKMTL